MIASSHPLPLQAIAPRPAEPAPTVIFQSAKLGDVPQIVAELERAERLPRDGADVGRVYGVSGGALAALAFALSYAARRDPARRGQASPARAEWSAFLRHARSRDIRALNCD